jgi:hypothetical protein
MVAAQGQGAALVAKSADGGLGDRRVHKISPITVPTA